MPGLPEAAADAPETTPEAPAQTPPPAADSAPESLETAAASAALGDFNLDDLLGSLPSEIPEEDLAIPDDLLNGLADDVEQSPPDTEFETGPEDPGTGPDGETAGMQTLNVDLDDLGDLGLEGPEGGAEGETGTPGADDFGGLDEAALGDFGELSLGEGDLGQEGVLGDFGDLDEAGLNLGETGDEAPETDLGDFGDLGQEGVLGDLGDLGLDETGLNLDETGAEAPETDLGDFGDLGQEGVLGDLGDLGLDEAGLNLGETGAEAPETDLGDFEGLGQGEVLGDLGDLGQDGDMGFGEEPERGGDSQGLELSTGDMEGIDLELEEGFGEPDINTGEADSFDTFDLEGTPAVPEEEEEPDVDLENFTLPGIDDMLGGAPGAPQQPGKGRKSFFSPAKEEEPEEIRLDDTDLANFRHTLAAYPLNLRLAVEEIIAERAVSPDQMAELVRLLVRGALPKETAALAGKILGKTISIPKGFQKKTGEQLEAERGSFAYVFAHNFLPVFRLSLFIAMVAASSFYLIWRFVYNPIHAENIYRLGYDRIAAGEYERANQRFSQAFNIHRDKNWFYRYAEAFRDQRQYLYAEEKYDDLLNWYPRDKKGVLDYAAMETYYIRNYEKADLLLRRNLLEFNPNDPEALLAQGDNALAWGETDPARYEDARFAYARLLDRYGWTDPVAERMLKYFIRTDNLKEVIPLQFFFMDNLKKKISAETLAELGGYLLDKRTEEVRGVPNEYREQITGVRDVLLRAVLLGPGLPEAHYHLSRYYRNLGTTRDEQLTLEVALRAFDNAAQESTRRRVYHIEALKRDAEILIGRREYFPAEARLVKAIGLYQNALERRLLTPAAQFGQLYAAMGDLEYFTKSGDMERSLNYYQDAEKNGYSSPEMLYRMGAAHYQREEWAPALERFFASSSQLPLNRRLLLALGNTCYQRGDYYAAQGYYNRLLDLLEAERSRLPVLLPNDRPEYIELAERLMIGQNNLGVTLEALSRSGGPRYLSQAAGLYVQSAQSWDALTRNPQSMIRLGVGDLSSPGTSLAFLNSRNILYPQSGYEPQLFVRIDRDVLEPSPWED
ncbi:MAG: tetratricopeptide repeat protein [Treponema sp.]|jgi:tetratricopeptide (TPR) repeat protein|nr:tetratricopeptide repeat protein [Treponema sp.]